MASGILSCGLGVHLCTCSVFYLAQWFWRLCFIAFLLGLSLILKYSQTSHKRTPLGPEKVSHSIFKKRGVRLWEVKHVVFVCS